MPRADACWPTPLRAIILPGGIALAAVVVVLATSCRGSERAANDTGPQPCSAEQRKVVGDLQEGQTIGSLHVTGITCPEPKRVVVTMAHATGSFGVTVTPLGADPHLPPVKTSRAAIYFGDTQGTPPSGADVTASLEAVAEQVRGAEGRGALPAGW